MNKHIIIRCMELSAYAYKDIQPYMPGTLTKTDDVDSGVTFFVHEQGDLLWITFRGTDSHQDWKVDFNFAEQALPYADMNSKIRVHTGFLNAYKAPGVRDKIHQYIHGGVRHIRISGHSMGAALSVICAVDLEYNFPEKDIEVVLFGCPRVGNAAFKKSYNKRVFKTIRVENGNDIVTKVPFAFMRYRHVGTRLHVGSWRLPFVFSTKAHCPEAYYASLLHFLLP